MSKEVVSALNFVQKEPVLFGAHLVLRVDDPKALDGLNIPSSAAVLDPSNEVLDLFKKVPYHWNWGNLEEYARRLPDQRWLSELANSLHQAKLGSALIRFALHILPGTYRRWSTAPSSTHARVA